MSVDNAYTSFWGKFLDLCDAGSLSVAPRSIPFQVISQDKNTAEVSLKEPIHLRDWPQRHGSTKDKLHILIHGSETVTRKTVQVVKSWVKVNYFELTKESARPLESIHYDFEDPHQNGHPLFHAQMCSDLIETDIINVSSTFQKYSISPKSIKDRIKTIKIPTAHMGFVSVLNCLLADHGAQKELTGMIALVKGSTALPKACNQALHTAIGKDGHAFRSFGWYP